MADLEPETKPEDPSSDQAPKPPRPWVRPVLVGLAVLLAAGGIGFGIGHFTSARDAGPDLSRDEAFEQARDKTGKEISRKMARLGFVEGRRSGRSHGIIAGGMAAESAVTIEFRKQRAAAAQNQAAQAQAELAGISGGGPPIPDFSNGD